jgi:L-lactate dehydrogenase complex protein LldE
MPRKVGLFIPCYIDVFFPEVGIATLELRGQPMAKSGRRKDAATTEAIRPLL